VAGGSPIAYVAVQPVGGKRVVDVPAEDSCENNVATAAGGLARGDRDHAEAITTITGGWRLGLETTGKVTAPGSSTSTANSQQRSRFI
jgi:hypothetical protein